MDIATVNVSQEVQNELKPFLEERGMKLIYLPKYRKQKLTNIILIYNRLDPCENFFGILKRGLTKKRANCETEFDFLNLFITEFNKITVNGARET